MSRKKSAFIWPFFYNLYLYKIMELSMKISTGPGPDRTSDSLDARRDEVRQSSLAMLHSKARHCLQ
jgi:hypothetical protein